MNFALLGDNLAAVPLLQAALAAGHNVVRMALAQRVVALHSEVASVRQCSWEELLIDSAVEAVIVAGETDEVQTAAKQLASVGKPLLIFPRVAFGTGFAYELSLIRDDSHVKLMPAFEHRFDSELLPLSQRLVGKELGLVRRLQVDRVLSSSSSNSLLTADEIEAASLDDIDLLHWLGGWYDQVTAMRSGQSGEDFSQASLILSGVNLPDAVWTARRGATEAWRLTVETEREPITIERLARPKAPAEMLAGFVATDSPDWSDAVRVFDVLDAAKRSLRRRRTIDLHSETLSERQQFKTQMTAIGCGMLMLTLVLMLALLGLGSLLESRDRAAHDAETLGLFLKESDFESHSENLTPTAALRLDQIAERLKEEPRSAYLEPSSDPPNSDLDQHRRSKIAERLANLGVEAADHRTLLAPTKSSGWETLMRILRLAWIAPLVLFLLMQGLILVARPASSRKP